MWIRILTYRLTLKSKFTIGHGSYNYRDHFIIELQQNNHKGFGETVVIDYYDMTVERLEKQLNSICNKIIAQKVSLEHFPDFLEQQRSRYSPFAITAFDTAYYDLLTEISGVTVEETLKLDTYDFIPVSSYTIGISDSPESNAARLDENWPFYKVKVKDVIPVDLFHSLSRNNQHFGVDANGSLDVGQAQRLLDAVEKYNGHYVEQLFPVGKEHWMEEILKPETILSFADESVTSLKDISRLKDYFDGFVLKLIKCGGITPVLEMIDISKSLGKKLLAGCMTESSIGINHMLSLLPLFDFADLDGAYLIANDYEVTSISPRSYKTLKIDGRFH